MDNYQTDLSEIINHIDPGNINYQEWLSVGMALQHEGYPMSLWDSWSRRDPARYHDFECEKKWAGFSGSDVPVTGGTIVQMALDAGWKPPKQPGHELDWEDDIGSDDGVVIDANWLEIQEIHEPVDWDPVSQIVKYLETLFESTENVGYVTDSWEADGRYMPTKGNWDRTAGQLIQELKQSDGDIGAVIGDYNPQVGAWIRFNPLDGQGVKNANVTDFRYALVESDSMPIDKQNAIIRELELPVACLVHSGKKSLHAIVKVDAGDYPEYRKRVDYLYDICKKNGLDIDSQNRNPSRLSRMPGIIRGDNKQYLVDTNIGKASWAEWKEWIESVNDDLPDPEGLSDVWDDMPALSPPLIDGVLRQGHKMLLAGPSKAGKSFALIELCCAIAEGREWLGWHCAKGRVLYVNLELDRASCLHRFRDVYAALGWHNENIDNIDIWNLRGRSVPMDKLAPKLIRRSAKKNYIAVILDPIYKVITGDENSADQMANFCNQFDKVCTELGAAVIYCHHHSKGSQGAKRSMDRASGSGVFARDPDALLDLIELDASGGAIQTAQNKAACAVCLDVLEQHVPNWQDAVSQDDEQSEKAMISACERFFDEDRMQVIRDSVDARQAEVGCYSAWQVDGTLREFRKFEPKNVWFKYPIHTGDESGILEDLKPFEEEPAWKKNLDKKKKGKTPEEKLEERKTAFETAYEACGMEGKITTDAIAEYMGISEKTVRRRAKEHGGFWITDGEVGRKDTWTRDK